jgi:hypothetical protein
MCDEKADFAAPPAARIAFSQQEFRHPVGPVLATEAIAGVA